MNETERICKNCEYYYKEHCCSGNSDMCTYTVSEDFRCEWWEEKSRMKTWQMIKELTENPEKEFTRKSDGLHIKTNEHGELIWDRGYQFLRLQNDWEEIKKPVDFITAIKSGKPISVEFCGTKVKKETLANILYRLQENYSDKTIKQIIVYGNWYIED